MPKSKKFTVILTLIFVLCLALTGIFGCNKQIQPSLYVDSNAVRFEKADYVVENGTCVKADGNAEYKLIGNVPQGVTVSGDGVFSIESDVTSGTQVLLAAFVGGVLRDTAVCTVSAQDVKPILSFENSATHLADGDFAEASSTPVTSVKYSLDREYTGIAINPVTGKVSFTEAVIDGTTFTVVATSHGTTLSEQFVASVDNLVTAQNNAVTTEYGVGRNVAFQLDFADIADAEVLGVMKGRTRMDDGDWTFNSQTGVFTILPQAASQLPMGENIIKIITNKNSVTVTVRAAKYVATARELASINDSIEALNGYYVMVCDIDLTDWLSRSGDGFNQGQGWNPIGKYFDVTDGTATQWAFTGTFDGNGHKITGFFIERNDDFAYNSGLFGYIAPQGLVKNLGVQGADGRKNSVKSYSGGFVGVNTGTIENCWADVDVYMESQFRVVGGFVGNNEGTITNCYSLGSVEGGTYIGSFAGMSQNGPVHGNFENCYALQTGSYPFSNADYDSCAVFSTLDEMRAADYSAFDDNIWTVSGGALPQLKQTDLAYDLREIFVKNTETHLSRGETLQLQVVSNPSYMTEQLGVTYTVVEGKGLQVNADGLINTLQLQEGQRYCKVRVSCGDVSAYFEFDVYEAETAVEFLPDMETTMYAGVHYYVDTQVLPQGANQAVDLYLTKSMHGVTLTDGIISVNSDILSDGEIEIEAVSEKGNSVTRKIQIVANRTFANNYAILYKGVDSTVTFALPDGVGATLNKVTRFDKSVDYSLQGNKVTLSANLFTNFVNQSVTVKMHTASGIYVAVVATYNPDVITIGSVEEFMEFKLHPELFDKVVILTADLDFQGRTITAVGNHTDKRDFTGIFNGNGHTIKNLNIDSNDMDKGPYTTEDDNGNIVTRPAADVFANHRSRYNVGLFGYLTGTVTNVCFENVNVASLFTGDYTNSKGVTTHYVDTPFGNCVGVAAGTVNGGIISYCTFNNCSARAADRDRGIVCGKASNAIVQNCIVDGTLAIL